MNQYMNVSQAGRYIGRSAGTMRNYADHGLIPCYIDPVNHWRYFKKEDLDFYLNQMKYSGKGGILHILR